MADPTETLTELRAAVAAVPFYSSLAIEPVETGDGTVTVAMDVDVRHANLQGSVHGGTLATLADAAMGLALRTVVGPERRHATIHLDVRFVRPAPHGRVRAVGRVVRAGARIGFAEAEVRASDDTIVATASGTFDVGPARATPA
jgi:uncharacterized protein (TIGR00369 family)